MSDQTDNDNNKDKAAIDFLLSDFSQSFQHLRHYDNRTHDVCKFMFTAYTALVGASFVLYKYAATKEIDLGLPIIAVLSIALVLGVFMFSIVIRNRVYFTIVTRYVNSIRKHFLDLKPSGFQNITGMYTSTDKPPFFNYRSSDAWFSYIIAILNSTLVASIIYFLFVKNKYRFLLIVSSILIAVTFQLLIAITYLCSREKKEKAEDMVW